MIVERVELTLKPGQECDYFQTMEEARNLITGAKGCRSVTLGRGIEDPAKALLLVVWDAVENHSDFTGTTEHAALVAKAGGFVASATVEHFPASERFTDEIKRRTNVAGIFPSEAAIARLIGAVLMEQNEKWVMQ